MTLGERIAYHRNRLGLSQGELAGRMNVSRQAVSKWETDGGLPGLTGGELLPAVAANLLAAVLVFFTGRAVLRRRPKKEE